MFATATAVRKAIESDGRRHLNQSSSLSISSASSFRPHYEVCLFLRAYTSHSTWPKWTAVSRPGKRSLLTTPKTYSSHSSGPLPIRKRKVDSRGKTFKEGSAEKHGPLLPSPLRWSRFSWESHTGNLQVFPQMESRAFLSSSSSSSESAPTNESRKNSSTYSTDAKIPIPKSSPTGSTSLNPLASIDAKAILKGSLDMTIWFTKATFKFLINLPGNTIFFATHTTERREKIAGIKESIKKEVDHYWVGIKLLMADVRTARNLLKKTLKGSTLTRRERKQLLRTVSDLFRLVPMSMFLIIPFMEFALPFALKIFPNMLPSTFQDSLKSEENMKRELQSRIAMAEFFQETMVELAREQKRIAANRKDGEDEPVDSIASKQEASASDMLKFLDLARKGEMVPPEAIIQYANYFQDDLTLDNMPRMQLINMCKYMAIPPYGSDSFLRFQLRHRIRMLKEDDQRILWEGIDSLTKMELREACQERGMRSTGLSKEAYKQSLQQWLDLSVNKNVPISLLIMSRTFFLQEAIVSPANAAGTNDENQSVAGLADAISGMDKEVLNEVILQVATSEEFKSDPDVRKIKLEVVKHQNEKIKEEQEERDAKKKKETSEKEDPQIVAARDDDVKSTTEKRVENKVDEEVSKEDLLDAIDAQVEEMKDDLLQKATEIEMAERELSPEEMESISQLLSADPVVKEKEHLARLKQSLRGEDNSETEPEGIEPSGSSAQPDTSPVDFDQSDRAASSVIESMENEVSKEADEVTSFTTKPDAKKSTPKIERQPVDANVDDPEDDMADEPEDPVVARLKKRIESMVDKIELQLSDVQIKIGDKLHYLDKDMDGILSRVEMADVLSQVLKDLTFEEALEIADEMDENKDGVFTVQELIKWIETNQLVKFESEGRDAEMDKIMESHSSEKDETNTRD